MFMNGWDIAHIQGVFGYTQLKFSLCPIELFLFFCIVGSWLVVELRAAAVLDDAARTRCRRPRPSPNPPPPRPRHTTGTWSPSAVSRRLEHARRWRQRQRQRLRRKERGGDSNRRSSGDLLFPCVMPATLLLKAKGAAHPGLPFSPVPPSPLLFLLKKYSPILY